MLQDFLLGKALVDKNVRVLFVASTLVQDDVCSPAVG